MRPVRLTMTAFGPYRDREIIDFTSLQDKRLFVIAGMTGAGKTSIFDAISYALYGSASGEDRSDHRMLRSHFADDDTHTSVDFEFTAGVKSYRVFRQMGHRKGNNKNETGGKIELVETTDGTDVPCARPIVSEVNAKLEEIIGLTREQFIQIVMLPQGEFRKLLTSDTENKEEILRRIFLTGLYQKLEGRFYERSRSLKDEHKEAAARLAIHTQHAAEILPQREDSELFRTLQQDVYNPQQVIAGLQLEEAHYAALAVEADERRTAVAAKLAQLEVEFRAASDFNLLFADLEQRRQRLVALELQEPQMEETGRRLARAEQAAKLEPYEEHAVQAKRDAEEKRQQCEAEQQAAERATIELGQARAAAEQEEARAPERLRAELEHNRLQELAPIVAKLDDMQREVRSLEEQKRALTAQVHQLDEQLTALHASKMVTVEQIRALEEEVKLLPAKQLERDQLRNKGVWLKELVQLEVRLKEYTAAETELKQQLEQLRREHDQAEQAWLEGQASLLAAHLHAGQPCPVCGSLDHPLKAAPGEQLPTRESLMRLKEQLRLAEQELHAAAAQAAAALASRDSKDDLIAEYGIERTDYNAQLRAVADQYRELDQAVGRLSAQADELEALRQSLRNIEAQTEQLSGEREHTARQLQECTLRHSNQLVLLDNELTRIPEELRTVEQLHEAIARQGALARSLQAAWQAVQQRLQDAEKHAAQAMARFESATRQAAEASDRANQLALRFRTALDSAGFEDEPEYQQAKLAEDVRTEQQRVLNDYRQSLHVIREQIAELEAKVAGRSPVDLAPLTEMLAHVRQELEQRTTDIQHAARCREDCAKLLHAVVQAHEHVKRLELELGQVLDLYQIIKGDNDQKLSFERYILTEYLDHILAAANLRLQHLTNGQFMLQRSDRLEARGRQSGLGLDVYDAYTGQLRDVKTLSGGEKFHASLALALGMTDVIQAFRGGVSIEMMFIDEGFGSLDEESLQKAVSALIELQRTGRMIGVISHVPELKEAFPAVLEVTKTKEGYSRTSMTVR